MKRRDFLALLPPLATLPACTSTRPSAAVREFTLPAQPGQALADSGRPIAAWTYGGTVPGPQVRLRQGERLRAVLDNRLPAATTVHWHGVRLPNAMDGVPHLTQPPIAPGARFVYEFDVPDAGTYWYHSHVRSSEQLERGLYGVLVVEERDPPPVHRDVTWVLDDWRITQAGALGEDFANAHDMSHGGRIGNVITVNGSVQEGFALRAGERVRLRLLNVANARIFALRFSGHRPLVISLDGQPLPPHEPQDGRVVLGPGMRCDLILDAVAAPGSRHDVQDVFYPRNSYVLMQLQYDAQAALPDKLAPVTALAPNPLPEPDLASAIVHEMRFEGGMMGNLHRALLDGQPMDMRGLIRRGKAWAINGVVHAGHDGHDLQPALVLKMGRSYVLRMRNDTRWHHPMHLHGHSFRIVRRNGQDTPHREWRDTALLAPGETVDVAFVADNPGDWMFHCHVLEHMEGGMMSVVRVE